MNTKDAVISVGGRGSRLAPFFNSIKFNKPKCLYPYKTSTILDNTINMLSESGFKRIFLLAAYNEQALSDYIKKYTGACKLFLVRGGVQGRRKGVSYVLYKIHGKLEKNFLYLDGNLIFNKKILRQIQQENDDSAIKIVVSRYDRAKTHALIIKKANKWELTVRLPGGGQKMNVQQKKYCSLGVMLLNFEIFKMSNFPNIGDLDVVIKNFCANSPSKVKLIFYRDDWLALHSGDDIKKLDSFTFRN